MDDERVIHSNFLNFNRYNDLYLFVLGFQPFGPILASFPLLAISTHRTHRAFKSTLYRYTTPYTHTRRLGHKLEL